MCQSLLRVHGLTLKFGGLVAVRDLSFNVNQGEIVGLIGPNGAGKTTAFNLITGTIRPSSGRVQFQNEDITGGPPSKVVVSGLARPFQRSEEHTSGLPSLMRNSYAVFCFKKKTTKTKQ